MNRCFNILWCFIYLQIQAQDINFSQFWNAPTQFDVARLASLGHGQAGIHYRNQWPNELNSYRTHEAHAVYPFLRQGLVDPQWGAAAIEVMNDASGLGGVYNTTQLKLTGNYKTALSSNHFLTFGLSPSMIWSSMNTDGLTSGNQYVNGAYQTGSYLGEDFTNTSSSRFTLDAGVRLAKIRDGRKSWHISASAYNLNQSQQGFLIQSTYPVRWSVSGGMLLIESAYILVQPKFSYQLQGESELTMIGTNIYYKLTDPRKRDVSQSYVGGGFYSRTRKDLIIAAEIKQENFTIGISYDFHTNKNSTRPTGSVEFFLSYNINVTPKSRNVKLPERRVKLRTITEETTKTDTSNAVSLKTLNKGFVAHDSANTTMVEMKLLDRDFDLNADDAEILFENLDRPLEHNYSFSYNGDSTAFIAYLSKNTNYKVTIKKEGYYNKTIKFNTGKRDSLEIPNRLKVIVLGEVLVLSQVHFKSGIAELEGSSEEELKSLVLFLKEYPNIRAEISGHTDDEGAEALNLALSQQRAETIVAYLVEQGIDKNRLVAKGFGKSMPLVPNTSSENRAKNRRVELKIIGK